MLHHIIDGNNLIGKISSLKKLQVKDRQGSREKLAFMLQRYYSKRNVKVSLHFDGYPKEEIKIMRIKVVYSENLTADDRIKKEIEESKNPKNLVVITSDSNLKDFARKCSCTVISSGKFIQQIELKPASEDESRIIQEMDDPDEFKKLFGV